MAVDALSRCYRFKARLIQGSNQEFWCRYYFCNPAAEILPFPTRFGSRVWENADERFHDVGPVDRAHDPDVGNNPGYLGDHYEGRPEWFIDGIPAAELVPPFPRKICGLSIDNALQWSSDQLDTIDWSNSNADVVNYA